MLIFDPKKETFSIFRMAYPMPFYTRGLDGRIDDAKAGWKGRGIWATYSSYLPKFTETRIGSVNHIQVRPNPLANYSAREHIFHREGLSSTGFSLCDFDLGKTENPHRLKPVLPNAGDLSASTSISSSYPSGKNTCPSINFLAVRPTITSNRRKFSFSPLEVIPTDMIPEGWAIRTVEEE